MKKVVYDPAKMVYYETEMDDIEKYFYDKLTPEEKAVQEMARALEIQDKIENQHFKHKDTEQKYIPKKVMCNKCGFVFEVEDDEEWAYCPICENGYQEIILQNGNNKLTIDRIDNNGNYEPNNCRWVDMSVQNKNKRKRGESR